MYKSIVSVDQINPCHEVKDTAKFDKIKRKFMEGEK